MKTSKTIESKRTIPVIKSIQLGKLFRKPRRDFAIKRNPKKTKTEVDKPLPIKRSATPIKSISPKIFTNIFFLKDDVLKNYSK
jgi:hypothetical protein